MKKYIKFSSIIIVLLVLTIPLTILLAQQHQNIEQQAATTNFSPIVIPATTEIGNPMRGPEYYGGEEAPSNFPLVQYSHRWCWNEIEPTQGQYNFNLIEDLANKAKTSGGSFGWRIMPVSNSGKLSDCLPSYLSGIQSFDDPLFLQRVQAMLDALSQKYANDPRIDVLDLSYIGCWGEWNNACGFPVPSSTTRQAIIDAQYKAFPNKRFLSLTDSQDSLDYALQVNRPKATGVRIDCLGQQDLGGGKDILAAHPTAANQWTKAPLYFEYCGGPDLNQSQQDIVQYHASLIGDGDGNLQGFSSYSTADQNLLLQNFRTSGYRYVLNKVDITSPVAAGASITVASQWSNVNVAPTYIPWGIYFQLRNQANQITWQGKSQLDLQTLGPTGNTPKSINDTFTLPSNIPGGTYTFSVQITDPGKYYPPLQLAIQGKQTDGSYPLGTITVTGSTNNTNPNPSVIIPSFACAGGINCVPSTTPGYSPTQNSPMPLTSITPCITTQSATANQEVTRAKENHHHNRNNSENNNLNSGLMSQLLDIIKLLLTLISQLLGNNTNTLPIPNTQLPTIPCPS